MLKQAYFAHTLQCLYRVSEEADVKHGQCEIDPAEVSSTVLRAEIACSTLELLVYWSL